MRERHVVHLAAVVDGEAMPACGSWSAGKSWSVDPGAANCAACLAVRAGSPAEPGLPPPAAAGPPTFVVDAQ